MEPDAADRGVLLEIGRNLAELDAHDGPPSCQGDEIITWPAASITADRFGDLLLLGWVMGAAASHSGRQTA
jgi:hypothetical protein